METNVDVLEACQLSEKYSEKIITHTYKVT